ncbi:MAG: polysaccharide deacetylase family protein [Desulfobacteraceae bacterium]|nr:polysaccharide deacetylase family protein [Desulfobacteraceae bacterium]
MDRIRRYCKAAIKKGLLYDRSHNPFKRGRIRGCSGVILQYHSVGPPDKTSLYIGAGLCVAPEDFERQIDFVTRYFRVVSLDKLMAHAGQPSTDETLFAITFDDGYRDNFDHAFPILRKYGAPALFYLTAACVGGSCTLWPSELRYLILRSPRPCVSLSTLSDAYLLEDEESKAKSIQQIKHRMIGCTRRQREEILRELRSNANVREPFPLKQVMLTWDQVRVMRSGGMSFGSHTLSHPSLPYVPTGEAKAEISDSRTILEDQLDEEIIHFSYPNPGGYINFNENLKGLLRNAGYRTATTSRSGYVSPGDDPLELKRKGVYAPYSKIPDFYLWIMKEALLQRWSGLPGAGLVHASQTAR